jgi:hypothetical protein
MAGFTGADFHTPKLESTCEPAARGRCACLRLRASLMGQACLPRDSVDAATGCQTYTLAYRVKRTRVAVDSGLRERDEDAAWDHALRA